MSYKSEDSSNDLSEAATNKTSHHPDQIVDVPFSPQEMGSSNPSIIPKNDCPTCSGKKMVGEFKLPNYVYALGTVTTRFPRLSVENEFRQVIKRERTDNLTDKQVFYDIVKNNRYLAREVCWVFTMEGIETYILIPRDPLDLDELVEAIKPRGANEIDTDVVIGERGPLAPREMCNGLEVPFVFFDKLYSFTRKELIDAIPKPKGMADNAFREASAKLFLEIQQLTDNVGAMDEHRAVNYLAVRYPQIYAHIAQMYANDFSFEGIQIIPSRLSVTRKLVNVIMSYVNRKTDVREKYYARVDVTEKYPFLQNGLTPFVERV